MRILSNFISTHFHGVGQEAAAKCWKSENRNKSKSYIQKNYLNFRRIKSKMEDKVCQFSKFGYCKYQENCKRIPYSQECEALWKCNNINKCEKRHPKKCNRFANRDNCRFKHDCAFSHHDSIENQENEKLTEKVLELKKKVSDMTFKMRSLKNKLHEIQKNIVSKGSIELKSLNHKEVINEVSNTQSSENHSGHDILKNVNKCTNEKEYKKLMQLKKKKQTSLL